MLLGFSTGCLYKTHDRLAPETFDIFRKIGGKAIEIMWHESEENISRIFDIKPEDLKGFEYVSMHAPSLEGLTDVQVVEVLEILARAHERLNFKAIVVHPHALINWEVLKGFNLPFVIENTSWRQEIGKYTDSMRDIFSKCDFPMVIDLNHCFTNDPTMHLAFEMIDAFRDRIVEIHVSGFESYNEPLFQTQQREILEAIFDRELPIIIESGCDSEEDAKKEFDYVKSFLLGV